MATLPSGNRIIITTKRLTELAEQYERTGEPKELGNIRDRDDILPFVWVLYFRQTPLAPDLPAGPCANDCSLASLEETMSTWPQPDQQAIRALLTERPTQDVLDKALWRVRLAQSVYQGLSGRVSEN